MFATFLLLMLIMIIISESFCGCRVGAAVRTGTAEQLRVNKFLMVRAEDRTEVLQKIRSEG